MLNEVKKNKFQMNEKIGLFSRETEIIKQKRMQRSELKNITLALKTLYRFSDRMTITKEKVSELKIEQYMSSNLKGLVKCDIFISFSIL